MRLNLAPLAVGGQSEGPGYREGQRTDRARRVVPRSRPAARFARAPDPPTPAPTGLPGPASLVWTSPRAMWLGRTPYPDPGIPTLDTPPVYPPWIPTPVLLSLGPSAPTKASPALSQMRSGHSSQLADVAVGVSGDPFACTYGVHIW